ncbi:MAG: HEAT repeat domain-containing protein, partial [Bacteroidota bacterium]
MILRSLLTFIFFLPMFSSHQDVERSTLMDILWHQDQRNLGGGRLERYVADSDWQVRMRAALAFPSVQDTSALPALLEALSDSREEVRVAAALAVGQTAGYVTSPTTSWAAGGILSQSEESPLNALRSETSTAVQGRIIEALGKFGSETAPSRLIEWGRRREEVETRRELAHSVARFAVRGLVTDEAARTVVRFSVIQAGDPRGDGWGG